MADGTITVEVSTKNARDEITRLETENEALRREIQTFKAAADREVALELSWVPVAQRGANWHAHATVQLRAMHAALHAAEKTPRDPLEIEELWDEAHEQWNQAKGDHADVHEIFARLLERAHGIGA